MFSFLHILGFLLSKLLVLLVHFSSLAFRQVLLLVQQGVFLGLDLIFFSYFRLLPLVLIVLPKSQLVVFGMLDLLLLRFCCFANFLLLLPLTFVHLPSIKRLFAQEVSVLAQEQLVLALLQVHFAGFRRF